MVHIIADHATLCFPLLGSDRRHVEDVKRGAAKSKDASVGGKIIRDSKGHPGVLAVDDFNVQLGHGDRVGIRGRNGSGKSTLLKMLGGIFPPTSGRVDIEGRIGGLFNLRLGLNSEANGYQNIILKGIMQGMRRKDIEALVPEIAAFSELGEYLELPVKTYSSGMIMRLLFSTATAMKPDILLLDEWVSTGDKEFREKVDAEMERIVEKTPIVIIASHNHRRLDKVSNVMITLEAGRAQVEFREGSSQYREPAGGKGRHGSNVVEGPRRLRG